MSKKIIKYLIWIILITALLILMPIKQSVAYSTTVYYSTFETSENLFCLNKGQHFTYSETFEVGPFSTTKFKEITGRDVNEDVLKYIMTESISGEYGDRTSSGDYIPQIAIWKLSGTSLSNSDADKLIASAYAYMNFINDGSPAPTVEKYGYDGLAIKYFQASGTYNGVTGSYTNLLTDTISVTGANYSTTQPVGGGYYRRIYTKTSGSTEATVTFNYETSRTASLEIYDSNEVAKTATYYYQENVDPAYHDVTGKVVKIDDTFYHIDCNGYQEPMTWINVSTETIENSELAISKFVHAYFGVYMNFPVNIDYTAVNDVGITTYYRCLGEDPHVRYLIGENAAGDVYRISAGDFEVKKVGAILGFGGRDELFAKLYHEKLNKGKTETVYEPQNLLHGTGDISTSSKTETVKFITPVKLNFNKKDFSGNDVTGATLRLEAVENVASLSRSSISIGSGSVTVYPAEGNSGTFKIKLTETAPTGYKAIPETTITVSYNDGTVTGISSSNTTYVPNSSNNTVTVKNRPAVKLTFKKQDFLGNALANAKISVTGYEKVSKISKQTLTSDANGNFGTIIIYPSDTSGEFKIQVEETVAPSGYRKMQDKVTITVKYNIDTGAVTEITSSNTTYVPVSGSTVTVKNRPVVRLTFKKEDFWGKVLANARISVTGYEKVLKVENGYLTSDANGNFGTVLIHPSDDTGEFKVKVRETSAPTGYEEVPEDVILTVKYNIDTGAVTEMTSSNTTYAPVSGSTTTVKNQSKVNFKIIKTDTLTGQRVPGMTFEIELTGVESIEGYAGKYPSKIRATTNSNGEINLNNILLETDKKQITMKIREVAVKDYRSSGYYYILDSTPIEITLTYNDGSWTIDGESVTGDTISSEVPTISGINASVEIKNKPFVNYNGMVWNDGQKGQKNVQGPNGKKDSSEKGLAGVIVKLYDVKAGKYVREQVITPETGTYSFMDIPRTFEGYRVEFRYDGINWQETKGIRNATGGDSDASENATSRTNFNNKYKTISLGKSNDGTQLSYTYNDNKSTLNVEMKGNETGTENYKFQMIATTEANTYLDNNADCGLVNKKIDLAIGTDVKSAELKINGKTTTYSYAQIMNGELADVTLDNILQNNSSSNNDVIYNLYLYSSDYHYRIEDYKTDIVGSEAPDGDENNVADYEELKNLEAFVTYSVILKNQTTNNATVNEFVYYYDAAYTPYNIVSTSKYDVSIDETNRKITFTSKNDGLRLTSPDYRVEIDLTFKVNKKADGYITTKTTTNIAEITKYSTDMGGLIDIDSEPGNATITVTDGTPKITAKYEDDIDEAKGLNIAVKQERVRTITGTVFNDTYKDGSNTEYDKDGILNNSNTAVNDVIVQLIEIKKIGGVYYEYIWQETRSGSNQVKTTARNGYPGTTYTNSVQAESGKFEFKDFIAGNYIIRYIYGDGTTYDITNNVKEYNGQDYKSTIDPKYNKAWYNTSNYSEGASVARDNESRRLEVMAYSTTIDETIGKALEEKTALNETWMCAETSKINIPVDADDKATETNSTTASYEYTANGDIVLFGDMNFGLALRPQANIVLEKHITLLKITPTGTGVQSILDAKAEGIESIVNGTDVNVNGITDGLATIKSTTDNRGFWQVATDVEELMQGAELEVEYTYVLRNDSEEDYLASFLIEEYKNGIDNGNYSTLLTTKAAEVKTNTKGQTEKYGSYLGQFYYTGTKGTNDALVISRIEKFEEALNNDFAFDENEATSFEIAEQGVSKHIYGVDKEEGSKETNIDVVVKNKTVSKFLLPKLEDSYTTETADWSRTIRLKTTLATVSGGELGANLPSYIAEILQYSNAAGRKDMKATPANLSYVHSDDSSMTMVSDNEQDEFWAETIIITKPTGEDKLTPIQIVLITIGAVAMLGVGIVLIKRFVLKK